MTQIIKNYATVLYELQISDKAVFESECIMKENPQLYQILVNPTINSGQKKAVIKRVFPKEIHHFLEQLCTNNRMGQLQEILNEYHIYAKQKKNITAAILYYVNKPNEAQTEKFKLFIKKEYRTEQVELQMIHRPELIGGFILSIGNQEYDWSLKGRIQRLQQKMIRR